MKKTYPKNSTVELSHIAKFINTQYLDDGKST